MDELGVGEGFEKVDAGDVAQHGSGRLRDIRVGMDGKRQGDVRVVWNGKDENFNRMPTDADLDLNPDAAYLHFTSNETIQGTEFFTEPDAGDTLSDRQKNPMHIEKSGDQFVLIFEEPFCLMDHLGDLREAGARTAPSLTLRAVAFDQPLTLQVDRHALAETLKLRVAKGTLTTILSPLGDRVTAEPTQKLLAPVREEGEAQYDAPRI